MRCTQIVQYDCTVFMDSEISKRHLVPVLIEFAHCQEDIRVLVIWRWIAIRYFEYPTTAVPETNFMVNFTRSSFSEVFSCEFSLWFYGPRACTACIEIQRGTFYFGHGEVVEIDEFLATLTLTDFKTDFWAVLTLLSSLRESDP